MHVELLARPPGALFVKRRANALFPLLATMAVSAATEPDDGLRRPSSTASPAFRDTAPVGLAATVGVLGDREPGQRKGKNRRVDENCAQLPRAYGPDADVRGGTHAIAPSATPVLGASRSVLVTHGSSSHVGVHRAYGPGPRR